MSSTIRKFSQIPVRTKYLLGIGEPSAGPIGEINSGDLFGNGGASIIKVENGTYQSLGPVATVNEITKAITDSGATVSVVLQKDISTPNDVTGMLFKDLGRTLTVYDSSLPGDLHIATYRECQLVNGATVEGVPQDTPTYGADYYVRVWAADGTGVAVARTG